MSNARLYITVAICVIAAIAILVPITDSLLMCVDTAIAHNRIQNSAVSTDVDGVYISTLCSSESNIKDSFERLPATIQKELKTNWLFYISDYPLMGEPNSASLLGATYPRAKVIWMRPNFTEEIFFHEIGHAIASKNSIDYSSDFQAVQTAYWECEQYTCNAESVHQVDSSAEFFAYLFEQYFSNPDELIKRFPEGYKWMDHYVKSYNPSFIFSITSSFTGIYNRLSSSLRNVGYSISSIIKSSTTSVRVKNNPKINIDDSTPYKSFAGLTEIEERITKEILCAINNIEHYSTEMRRGSSVIALEYETYLSLASYNKIAACVDFDLFCEASDAFDMSSFAGRDKTFIYIYVDKAKELVQKREEYKREVERVLETINEGDVTERLLQVSKYIADNCSYEVKSSTSGDDFWIHHKGDCVTYSMTFRMFCERLGIHCDIITGTSITGESHMWNRVKLPDGSFRYYDLTYYRLGTIDLPRYSSGAVCSINSYLPIDRSRPLGVSFDKN